jgi:NADH-quinone oxidoreductase subunit G
MGVEIFVDGAAIEVDGSANLLQGCLAAGKDVPYFCWHPALGSVGACRLCAVTVFAGAGDATGTIAMACMTRPVAGMRVGLQESKAAAAREAVVEFVLANHPHDCPVCEVGGECHLQDMSAMTGHAARRVRYPKRTHRNQDLGPFIRHEMNRCIGCYRCVRFYKDYAGGSDFGVFGSAKNVFFGRVADGVLESKFAGNLVEVCPTGVFVDKPFSQKFRRKWDMRATPSVCPHCAVGCNISLHERDGVVRRAVNRFNPTLNGYFLCDRGRFGVGFLESDARLRVSVDRYGKVLTPAAAVAHLARILGRGDVVGVGSARASLEVNFVLRRLVGAQRFFAGVSAHEAASMAAAMAAMRAVKVATLQEVEAADAALVLGQDPGVVAPRLALALRQVGRRPDAERLAARDIPAWDDSAARVAGAGQPARLAVAATGATTLDDVARVVRCADGEAVAAFGLAVAGAAQDGNADANQVAGMLGQANRPVVVVGGGAAVIYAGASIVAALAERGVDARLCVQAPSVNSVGLACFEAPSAAAMAVAGAHLLVLETDLLALPGAAVGLAAAGSLTCLDHIGTATTRLADMALAVASFAESDGMFVNMEGRAQRFHKAVFGREAAAPAWEMLRDAGIAAGILPAGTWPDHMSLVRDMAAEMPALAPCLALWPAVEDRPPGLPHRHSGRTAARAHIDVREAAPPASGGSAFGTTMEGAAQMGAEPLVWAPGWNSGQAVLRLPVSEAGVFLFETTSATALEAPETSPSYEEGSDIEEMSALAPAIIARRLA